MKNYVYIYYNDGTRKDISAADSTAAYGAWFGKLGESIVDSGNPFNDNGMVVEKSGVSPIGSHPSTGYTIVKASNMEDAVALAKDCPLLDEPRGAVRVYETLPM